MSEGAGSREQGTVGSRPWAAAEREYVLAHLDDKNLTEIGEALGRTATAVRGYLAVNGIMYAPALTEEQGKN